MIFRFVAELFDTIMLKWTRLDSLVGTYNAQRPSKYRSPLKDRIMFYNDSLYNDSLYNDSLYNDALYNDALYTEMGYGTDTSSGGRHYEAKHSGSDTYSGGDYGGGGGHKENYVFSVVVPVLTIILLYIIESGTNIDLMPDPSIHIDVLLSYAFIFVVVWGLEAFILWIFGKSNIKKSVLSILISSFFLSVITTLLLYVVFIVMQDIGVIVPYVSPYFMKLKETMLQLSNYQSIDTILKFVFSFAPGWIFFFVVKVIRQRGF